MIAKIKTSTVFAFEIYFYFLSLVFSVYNLSSSEWVLANDGHTSGLFKTCFKNISLQECRMWSSYKNCIDKFVRFYPNVQ